MTTETRKDTPGSVGQVFAGRGEWRVGAPCRARFQEQGVAVNRGEGPRCRDWRWVDMRQLWRACWHRRLALSYMTVVAAGGGAAAGYWQTLGRRQKQEVTPGKARYSMVDPYQKHGHY